jgi:hypothetical protein
MKSKRLLLLPALLGASLFSGCGSESGNNGTDGGGPLPGDDVVVPLAQRYLPLAAGMTWTYKVIDNGVTTMKVQTVEAIEAPPVASKSSVQAFRVKTTKGVNDQTVSWQENRGNQVIRHAERSFAPGATTHDLQESWEPYKTRLDQRPSKLKAGTTWTVQYTETHEVLGAPPTTTMRSEKWTVMSVSEPVTVTAGTFKDCLLLRRQGTDTGAASDKFYWYARGVGKLRETGGQTEELTAFSGLPRM